MPTLDEMSTIPLSENGLDRMATTPFSSKEQPEPDYEKVYNTAIEEDLDFNEAEVYTRIQDIPDPDSVSEFPVDFEMGLEDEDGPHGAFDVQPEKPTGQKIKEWFAGKPEDVTLPEPIGRAEKLDVAIKKTGRPLTRTFYKWGKGRLMGTPEIGWAVIKKVTGDKFENVKDMSLDEAVDWALDYNPSGFTKTVGEIAEFAGGVQTARNFLGPRPKGSTFADRAIERFNIGAGQKLARETSGAVAEGIDKTDRPTGGPAEVLKEGAWLAGLGALGDGYSWAKNTPLGMAVEEKLNWELLKVAAKSPTFSQAMDLVRKNPSNHFIKQALRVIKKNGQSVRDLPKESWAAIKHMARFKEMQLRQMFNLTPIEQIVYPAPKPKALLMPPKVADAVAKSTPQPTKAPEGKVAGVGTPKAKKAIHEVDHPLAQGKTHAEMSEMDIQEYADTIHRPAFERWIEAKKELKEAYKNKDRDAIDRLKEEVSQLFQLSRGTQLPAAAQQHHKEVAEDNEATAILHDIISSDNVDIEMLELQLENIEKKVQKGSFTLKDLDQTELFKAGSTSTYAGIKEMFTEDPGQAILDIRNKIAQPQPQGAVEQTGRQQLIDEHNIDTGYDFTISGTKVVGLGRGQSQAQKKAGGNKRSNKWGVEVIDENGDVAATIPIGSKVNAEKASKSLQPKPQGAVEVKAGDEVPDGSAAGLDIQAGFRMDSRDGEIISTGAFHDVTKIDNLQPTEKLTSGFVIDGEFVLPEEAQRIVKESKTQPQPRAEPEKGAIQKFIENEDGFVDFTPLEKAGPQVRSLVEKGSQVITRFTGLEKPVQQVLIEYEEQLREIPKFAAQEGIDKFGHLSEADERLVEDYQERKDLDPAEFEDFPDNLKQVHRQMVDAYGEIGERLKGLGFGANWPKSQIEFLEEKKARLEASDDVDVDEVGAIQDAIDVLEQVGYVHHSYLEAPMSKKVKRWFGKRISDKPTGLLGRKFPTYEVAEKEGFKRASLAATYADALDSILRAEEAHRLIVAINNNPDLSAYENEAPDDWEKLKEEAFPSSVSRSTWVDDNGKVHIRKKVRKYPPALVDALEELTYSRGNHPLELAFDKFNMFLKLVGFYNPVFMPMYDMQQMWRAVGVKGAAYLPEAWKIFREKGDEFHKLRKGGLFNNVVNWVPAAQSLAQEMIDQARLTDDAKVKALILKYANPLNYMQNLRAAQQATTWSADEVIRIACYEAFKDSPAAQGLTEFEKIEYVNDAMVNYAKLPKETKRWLNKLFFVPNYRIGNFRFFWSQLAKHPNRFKGAMARTFGWKAFVKWGLPAIVTSALVLAGSRKRAYSEKGYKMIIFNPDTNTDTVYSIGGPLLEGQKLTQRNLRQSFDFNLAALPHLGYRVLTGPRQGQTDDVIGEFFKLGTPIWRDIVTAKGKDRKPVEKVLTLMAVAYTYQRQHKDKMDDDAVTSTLKMMSVWTDWREQGEDIKRMAKGKTGYFGPGGEFDRLLRQFEVKKKLHQGKIDKELTRMFRQGDDKDALTYAFEEKRFKSIQGFSGRYVRAHAPLVYFWETMPAIEQAEFLMFLKDKGYDIDTSKVKSIKTLDKALPQDMKDYMEQQIINLQKSRESK